MTNDSTWSNESEMQGSFAIGKALLREGNIVAAMGYQCDL